MLETFDKTSRWRKRGARHRPCGQIYRQKRPYDRGAKKGIAREDDVQEAARRQIRPCAGRGEPNVANKRRSGQKEDERLRR